MRQDKINSLAKAHRTVSGTTCITDFGGKQCLPVKNNIFKQIRFTGDFSEKKDETIEA